ncbi:hypothetical protein Pelo_19252 [Pelomyxa schiedti]|nr:hypothetical protein Pelo_19252 [Pelomyxa schiedti]
MCGRDSNNHLIPDSWGNFRITLIKASAAKKLPHKALTLRDVGKTTSVAATDIEEIHEDINPVLKKSVLTLLLEALTRVHKIPSESTSLSDKESPESPSSVDLPLLQQYNAYRKSPPKSLTTAQFTLTELKEQRKQLKTFHDEQIKLHKKICETTQQECSLQHTQEMRLLEENVKLLKTHNEDLKKELSDLKKELTAQRESMLEKYCLKKT